VLIGGSLPFDGVTRVFVNLFQLILLGGVGGDEVIGELFICRSTELWSEESSF